jgi:hypothetical protein
MRRIIIIIGDKMTTYMLGDLFAAIYNCLRNGKD